MGPVRTARSNSCTAATARDAPNHHSADNHLVLWDLRPEGITGNKMEKACDLCHVTLNKNAGGTQGLAVRAERGLRTHPVVAVVLTCAASAHVLPQSWAM